MTANQQWTGTREWSRSIAIIYVTRLSTITQRENQTIKLRDHTQKSS